MILQHNNDCCHICIKFKRLLAENYKARSEGYCCKTTKKNLVRPDGSYNSSDDKAPIVNGSDYCKYFEKEDPNNIGLYQWG
jgi:hypothetical protein